MLRPNGLIKRKDRNCDTLLLFLLSGILPLKTRLQKNY